MPGSIVKTLWVHQKIEGNVALDPFINILNNRGSAEGLLFFKFFDGRTHKKPSHLGKSWYIARNRTIIFGLILTGPG
jgi:hypothetical protein